MSFHKSAISFHPDFLVRFLKFNLQRTYYKYIVLVCNLCGVFFLAFSLARNYPPRLVWFYQNKGLKGASGSPVIIGLVVGLREQELQLTGPPQREAQEAGRLSIGRWPQSVQLAPSPSHPPRRIQLALQPTA